MSEQETQAADDVQEKRTFVEDGSEFKGNLVSSCHVVVRGKIEGEIMAPKLTVTESGSVVGNVHAERIHSEGVLAGTIEAEELYLSGQVRDDTVIRAKSMEVKLSSEGGKYEVSFGACTLAVGDDPRAELQTSNQAQAAAPALAATEQAPAEKPMPAAEASAEDDTREAAEASDENKDGRHKRKGKSRRGGQAEAGSGAAESASAEARPSTPPPA